jgi:hypothetical protein
MMLEIERRRRQLGISMDTLSDLAGFADRFYSKALHPDTPSGRQSRWETVQEMMDAIFPEGFDIEIRPKPGGCMSADDLRRKVQFAGADANPITRRKLMAALGRKGALARHGSRTPEQRREIALRAAATRKANRTAGAESAAQI